MGTLKNKVMNSHGNNFLSIFFGSTFTIISYIAENPIIKSMEQVVQVVLFGLLGGIMGYFGKLIGAKIHKFFRNENNN